MHLFTETSIFSRLSSTAWFCVRSHPKREHIAAAHLRKFEDVEVFNPRLRVKKATRRGVVTFVEALFPNYLFARFDPFQLLSEVKHCPNVSTVVHFGARLPAIPDEVIAELKAELGDCEIRDCDAEFVQGDTVTIGEGPFYGMSAKVLRVLTPYQRVEVLLEMLGRVTPVVVDPCKLLLEERAVVALH